MAENTVEISNVVGARGVASEVTLLMLLEEMKKQSGGSTSRDSEIRARKMYVDSIGRTKDSTSKLGSAFKNLGSAALRTTEAFAQGARRSEEFAQSVMGGTGIISNLFGMLDNTTDMFRAVSQVGAGFSNNMFEMIHASANSAMELVDFANLVRNNSQSIRLLGGTVSSGAVAFGEFSKELRNSEFGYRLMSMGFTMDDLNDGLVSYIDLQTSLGRRELLRTQNIGVATGEYLEDLDALAKVTGKSREELASLTNQIASDARVRALAARASQDGADDLTKNLALVSSAVPGLSSAFIDLADGFPQEELSKALMTGAGSAGRALADLMTRADEMDPDTFAKQFTTLAPQVADFLKERYSAEQIAAMEASGGIAGAIAQLTGFGAQLDRTAMMDIELARKEAARQNRITGIFGNFENAIISARRFLVDAFMDSKLSTALSNLGETLGNMISGVGTGTFEGFGSMLGKIATNIMDTLGGFVQWVDDDLNSEDSKIRSGLTTFGEYLTNAASAVQEWFTTFQSDVQANGLMATIKQRFTDLADRVKNYVMDLFLGEVQTEPGGPDRGQRQGGLLDKITTNLTNMFDTITDKVLGPQGDSDDRSVIQRLIDKVLGPRGDGDNRTVFQRLLDKVFGPSGENGDDQTVLQRLATAFDNFLSNNTVIQAMKDSVNEMTKTALNTVETNLRSILGMSEGQTFQQKIDDMIRSMTNLVLDIFNTRIPQLMNTIITSAKNALSEATSGMGGSNLTEDDTSSAMQRMMRGETLDPETRDDLIRTLRNEVQQKSMDEGGLSYFMGSLGKGASLLMDPVSDLLGFDNAVTSNDAIRATIQELYPDLEYASGTNGFENFGTGTLATLHGAEAVVPRNTPAGEMLQEFYNRGEKTSTPSAPESQGQSQSQIVEKLNQLNTTMQAVVSIMSASNAIDKKQLAGIRTLGSDYYRGIGR